MILSNKEVDIIRTKQDLAKAQKARDKQYENMKKRIQCSIRAGRRYCMVPDDA